MHHKEKDTNQKKAGVAILISDKIDLKMKNILGTRKDIT